MMVGFPSFLRLCLDMVTCYSNEGNELSLPILLISFLPSMGFERVLIGFSCV